jgi:hypothetical protein
MNAAVGASFSAQLVPNRQIARLRLLLRCCGLSTRSERTIREVAYGAGGHAAQARLDRVRRQRDGRAHEETEHQREQGVLHMNERGGGRERSDDGAHRVKA